MAVILLVAAGIYLPFGERRDAIVLLAARVPLVGVDAFLEGEIARRSRESWR